MKSVEWMDHIACKDLDADLFFPDKPGVVGRAQAREAARICKTCPVQLECAEHRVVTGAAAGVWGGRSTVMRNASASSGGPRGAQLHGTDAGYNRHLSRGEKPCQACWSAHSRKASPNGRSRTKRWSA